MTLEDYISGNPHRDWVLKYLAESLWYPGDLSLVRKVTSAVWEELSSIASLYRSELEREGWESVESRLISCWRRDLSKYKNPDEVLWGELTGLNPQVFRIVKGIFPSVSHYSKPSAAALKATPEEPKGADLLPALPLPEGKKKRKKHAAAFAAGLALLLLVAAALILYGIPPGQQAAPDLSPPSVLYTGPPNGSVAMNPVTLVVRYADDSPINLTSIRLVVNGVEVRPDRATASETVYSAELPLGMCQASFSVSDVKGNSINVSWSFTVSSLLQSVSSSVVGAINEARASLGLPPVTASTEYAAADFRAKDMLSKGYFNHYDLSGLPPTYYYTIYGGAYAVEENLGYVYYPGLTAQLVVNDSVELIHDMIYDDAASSWGHRDSLLDPTNNRAEVGLAWNGSRLFLVVHMIKEWVDWAQPPQVSAGVFSCSGNITMNGSGLKSVLIYYTDPAQHDSFSYDPSLKVLVGERGYSLGSLVGGVAPLPMFYPGLETIRPSRWQASGQEFSLAFSTSSLKRIAGPGVYTIVVYASNALGITHPYAPDRYAEQLPILTYSVLVE